MSDFEKKLSKAKIGLLNRTQMIFFASIVMSVKHMVENNLPTAATDGISIKYNEAFFNSLSKNEREFLIAHEALHIILEHCTSRNIGMDKQLWNKAADYVINLMLVKAGMTMPKGGLYSEDFTNMSTLQVYRLLEQDQKSGKNKYSSNQAMAGQPMEDLEETTAPDMVQKIQQQVEDIVVRAKIEAEMAGKPPGELGPDLDRLLNKLTKPQIPWQRLLARFFNALGKCDYTYSRPNRRYIAQDIYLPSLYSNALGRVDFAIDTSGSITDEIFTYFIIEAHFVLKKFNPEQIGIMQFDHKLRSTDVISSARELLQIKMKGGGGTRVDEAIEAFHQNNAQALFVLTDGYVNTHHLPNPGKPVIWCVYSNTEFNPPWGTVVHFTMPEAA